MKKILLLSVFILFLTGCSATYNIEIYNNKVREDMEYIESNAYKSYSDEYTYGDMVRASVDYPYSAFYDSVLNENDNIKLDNVEYYKNKLIDKDGMLGQSLSYHKFKLDNYNKSSIVRTCYQYFNVLEEEDRIVLSTSLKNNCFDQYPMLDEITINLKTNHKVISSNANVVKGYHYTWNITRENKDNANISIVLKKDDYVFNYENEFVKKVLTYVGIVVIIGIVIGGIYLHLKNKHDRINQI